MSKDAVWGTKASPEVCELLDSLFKQSGFTTKKDFLEHLARLEKANQIKVGSEASLSPELLKISAGDLSELMSYTDGINKLYIRMIERSGIRENALTSDKVKMQEEHMQTQQDLHASLSEAQRRLKELQYDYGELQKQNELLVQENGLIAKERLQHQEKLRLKDEAYEQLQKALAAKEEQLSSLEATASENKQLQEQLRMLIQTSKDEKRDFQLQLVIETQKIRDAAQQEIAKYRDELTAQLKEVALANLKKPVGRPAKKASEEI